MKLHLALTLSFFALAACAPADEIEEDEGETTSNLSAGVHIETQSNAEEQRLILRRVVEMIDSTPDNGKIFAAIHSISDDAVTDALIAKAKKGATVKVVVDGDKKGKPAPEKLKAALKGNFKYCGHANGGFGCIAKAGDGIMHSKLFLFSRTKDEAGQERKDVTWMSSANMTEQTGANTFNNAVAIYGDDNLHDTMKSKYFDRLWDESSVPGTIVSEASKTVVYASPTDEDLVAARLANVERGAPCNIGISQNMIHFNTRPEIMKQLKRVSKFCSVKVLVNHINKSSFDDLKDAGIEARYSYTHDKVFLIDAMLNGRPQKVAFTGSHNWTRDAQVSNDELLVRLADRDTYNAMAGHLLRQWAKSSKLAPGM